jgi:cation/acetate symporter
MVGLAFAIAASCNFPVLAMSIFWKGTTTRGALVGGFLGLLSATLMVIVSPQVWETTLGNPKGSALFPYDNPALFSMTIAFFGIWLFSITDRSKSAETERAAFQAQYVRSETGLGASGTASH